MILHVLTPNLYLRFSVVVGTFVDGLIAFYFARKHRSDEAKWTAIGEDVMVSNQSCTFLALDDSL
jgi:hypothetical protein